MMNTLDLLIIFLFVLLLYIIWKWPVIQLLFWYVSLEHHLKKDLKLLEGEEKERLQEFIATLNKDKRTFIKLLFL